MKLKKKLLTAFSMLLYLNCLYSQLGVRVFSYNELAFSSTERFDTYKDFYTIAPAVNFSPNWGMSIQYNIMKSITLSLGTQWSKRSVNCDCIEIVQFRLSEYRLSDGNCLLKAKKEYHFLQMPLTIYYQLSKNDAPVKHFVGIGNLFSTQKNTQSSILTLQDSLVKTENKQSSSLYTLFAPELIYRMEGKLYEHLIWDISIGVRKETLRIPNYAIFGKVGLGYQFDNTHTTKRYKKR